MSSQTKEIVTERTDAARSVHRPGEESSKLKPGSCEELGKASVKCIEKHGYNRSAPECLVHFDAYKECRKKETASRQGLKSFFGSG
ncbi:hypothetical protein Ctob_008625 [Chrysochromulina tobinii]|uniref:CHCH domain-containing protein n=1 Tax=Chrysochromulina tobinii TaxID=1460289 RepID=A0A0M0K729_9EUKA|nr:hypothetical protein Ctob_008625 [Chrysochromulina tobinii]|eukprot:KOO34610.1 hypothetical protein Ctob_008625 [Chrysochromulina sp. CCMP291]